MKRELDSDSLEQTVTSSSNKAVKLSVSRQDSPISKQLSKECVEAIQFYNKNYPARFFDLMNKFTTGSLSVNGIKAEYLLLENKLKILQPLLTKLTPKGPAFLRVQEFHTKYFEIHQIIKSFLFCHEVTQSTDDTQDKNAKKMATIQVWIKYYNYEMMGILLFLNALSDPSVRDNMLIELRFHVHFLSTLKHFIYISSQKFPALTYEDHLEYTELTNIVSQSLDEISAILIITQSLNASIPDHISPQAELLVNNINTLNNTEKLETIIEKLENFRANIENTSQHTDVNKKLSQFLKLIEKISQETSPIIGAVKAVSDFIYTINFSDETVYLFKKLVATEQQLSAQLKSLNDIKIHFESMLTENNTNVASFDC